jgi:hypothetical protein
VLALQLPHSEFVVIGIFFFVAGVALLTIARFWPFGFLGKPVVTSVFPVETSRLDSAGAPSTSTGPVMVLTRAITWPALVDPDAGDLDETERRRVIDGLGIVGDVWCAGILAKAFEEENDDLRVAAIESLGICEGDIVAPTLERAYASNVVAERYAAADGASRRGDVPLLERALRDNDATVALAAAYGLHRANRNDLIEDGLENRTDARANEIRRVLAILA